MKVVLALLVSCFLYLQQAQVPDKVLEQTFDQALGAHAVLTGRAGKSARRKNGRRKKKKVSNNAKKDKKKTRYNKKKKEKKKCVKQAKGKNKKIRSKKAMRGKKMKKKIKKASIKKKKRSKQFKKAIKKKKTKKLSRKIKEQKLIRKGNGLRQNTSRYYTYPGYDKCQTPHWDPILCGRGNIQAYPCDMFGYTRDASVSRTLNNMATRIARRLNYLDNFITKATSTPTKFDDIIIALGVSTEFGTSCKGSPTMNNIVNAKKIYDILNSCQTTVPIYCDKNAIAPYNSVLETKVSDCQPKLEEYSQDYKFSIFDGTNAATDDLKYQKVCRNLGSPAKGNDEALLGTTVGIGGNATPETLLKDGCLGSFREFKDLDEQTKTRLIICKNLSVNSTIVGANLTQLVEKLETDSISSNNTHSERLMKLMEGLTQSGCLSGTFKDMDTEVKKRLSLCTDPDLSGSYANCTAAREEAISYVNSCKACTPTGTITTLSPVRRKLKLK